MQYLVRIVVPFGTTLKALFIDGIINDKEVIGMKVKVKETALVALVMIAVLVLGSLNSYAMGPARPKRKNLEALAGKLDLTDEQRQQLDNQRQATRERKDEIREKLSQQWELFQQEVKKPKPDARKLKKIATRIKGCKNKLLDVYVNSVLGLTKILTEEQYIELQKMYNKKSFWGGFRRSRDKPPCPKKKGFK